MDNLYKLAEHLLEEADRLAKDALHTREPKHIDIVLKYCDAHQNICESLEFYEDWKADGMTSSDGMLGAMDNPRRRHR